MKDKLLQRYRSDRLWRIKLALLFFIPGMLAHFVLPLLGTASSRLSEYLTPALILPAYLISGIPVIKRAFQQLQKGSWMTEHFLMSLATFGALGLKAWPEAAAVMIFYEIGEYAQSRAIHKSRDSIAELLDLAEDLCLVERDGTWQEVDTDEVEVGESILIAAGARVPLDVEVLKGIGEIDSSALTGEALPQVVEPGDKLLSGSLNLNNPLTCKVLKSAEDSTLNKIIEISDEASLRKGKTERLISRFAKYYTPIVVILALLICVLPPLLFAEPCLKWFIRSLNLLVISCPCALVLSVPLTYFAALGLASTHGILVKGSDSLEKLSEVGTIVFDKTGTLTTGQLSLEKIELCKSGLSEEEVLSLALQMEEGSTHVFAKAFRKAAANHTWAKLREISASPNDKGRISASPSDKKAPESLTEIPGRGVKASFTDAEYYLGNARLMQDLGLRVPETEAEYSVSFLARKTKSDSVESSQNSEILAKFLFADEVKTEAASVLQTLRKQGVRNLIMFSGDRKSVVEAQARKLGLDAWEGELLPQDKLLRLEVHIKEQAPTKLTAFVGDGINDSPALSLADVGIAMGGVGSDAAVEAADMVLIRDELAAISEVLSISRETKSIARQNIIFSLGIKILVIILSLFGIGGMWAAIFADVGVTLLAIANSFRIVWQQDSRKKKLKTSISV